MNSVYNAFFNGDRLVPGRSEGRPLHMLEILYFERALLGSLLSPAWLSGGAGPPRP